ncbi:hypothetical protein TrST_g11950 [Triparma strigata]|uniref:PHD-type domain-containing protein n=1 Tax=Triparma strigata TaxID=1606541 RepID=A0A9W7EK94_9STRA|nr:hypothetical protein TrST_g11950 [Triparma strigata]
MASINGRVGTFNSFERDLIYGQNAPTTLKVHCLLHDGPNRGLPPPSNPSSSSSSSLPPSSPPPPSLPQKRPLSGCLICAVDDDHPSLLVCDHCDTSEFHLYCLSPRLPKVPTGKWLCPPCAKNESNLQKTSPQASSESNDPTSSSSSNPSKPQGSLSGFLPLNRSSLPHIDAMFPASHWSVKRSYDGHYIFFSLLTSLVFYKLGTAKEYLRSESYRNVLLKSTPLFGEKCFEEIRADLRVLKSLSKGKGTSSRSSRPSKWSLSEKIIRPKRGQIENEPADPPSPKKFKSRICSPAPLPLNVTSYVYDKSREGSFVWIDPVGSPLFNNVEGESASLFSRTIWSSRSKIPIDMPLSWPAEILSPYDRRVSTEIREVWEEKFMVRKKGKNERYIVRVLGPVTEGYEGWNDFIVIRSEDQMWGWEEGIAAGCVRSGLHYSGVVYSIWGWSRRTFEDALGEAGWWGTLEKYEDKEEYLREIKERKETIHGEEREKEEERKEVKFEHARAIRNIPKVNK